MTTTGQAELGLHAPEAEHVDLYERRGDRTFTSSSGFYFLPADELEHHRLDLQHIALTLSWGGSSFPLQEVVKPAIREKGAQILDVGCGSGRWALDMAQQYPSASVQGFDLVHPHHASAGNLPSNVSFSIKDANLQATWDGFEAAEFDVAQARCVDSGVSDQQKLFHNIARVLKPEGVIIATAGSPQYYDENFEPVPYVEPGQPKFSWVQYVIGHIYLVHLKRGNKGVKEPQHYARWLSSSPDWSAAHSGRTFIPLGPWNESASEEERYIGALMRDNILNFLPAGKPLLMAGGYTEEEVDSWIANATTEIKSGKVRLYNAWNFTVAVRSDKPWEEEVPRMEVADESPVKGLPIPSV